MRYLVANLATNSSFEITVDIMLRDSSLVSGNFIVRLIYKVGANSIDDKIKTNEALETRVDSDQINYVIYSINGLGATQLFVRNMCLDVCKGLRLKCNKCTKNINELRDIDNDFKNSRKIKSVYYKIYQISLKGIWQYFFASLLAFIWNLPMGTTKSRNSNLNDYYYLF